MTEASYATFLRRPSHITTAGQHVDYALLMGLVAPNRELIQVFSPAQLLHHTDKGGHHMRISDIFAMGGGCGHGDSGGCFSDCSSGCRPFNAPYQLEGPDFRNDLSHDKKDKWDY